MIEVTPPVLTARGIRVGITDGADIVEDVDLTLRPGEIMGLVGESGSGKTTTALSLFGYQEAGLSTTGGLITIAGTVLGSATAFRDARGRLISYVPQVPGLALNPSLRIWDAVRDVIETHGTQNGATRSVDELFDIVGLPVTPDFGRRFPHQLSGGQQQRVCIAAAIAANPAVVVLDEPTTGLDVITQARILDELMRLRDEEGIALLYITHDLAVVSMIANTIAVMYAGRIVERGTTARVLTHPRHPYTRGLILATPDHVQPQLLEVIGGRTLGVGDRPSGCTFEPRCRQATVACASAIPDLVPVAEGHDVRCIRWSATDQITRTPVPLRDPGRPVHRPVVLDVSHLQAGHRTRTGDLLVVRDVSFEVKESSCVALVGESGSGKSTIARVLAGLHAPLSGDIQLSGEALASVARKRTREQRQRIQMVFQNPSEALNPRHTVLASVARPAHVLQGMTRRESESEASRLLDAVQLNQGLLRRYPRELSGGERQRVALARALAAKPDLMLCDEITSALDVSVQAVVLELLRDLREQFGVAMLFITHDLGVTATVAERVLVLKAGRICEDAAIETVLHSPTDDYTKRLLAAAPRVASV